MNPGKTFVSTILGLGLQSCTAMPVSFMVRGDLNSDLYVNQVMN